MKNGTKRIRKNVTTKEPYKQQSSYVLYIF